MAETWLQNLRKLHDENFAFALSGGWDVHLEELNTRLGRSQDPFATPAPGLPPVWFVGDVEALRPREWVLVCSLNQAHVAADEPWHTAQQYTSQSYWDHWRFLNRDPTNLGFYGRLIRLAARLLDVPVNQTVEPDFATTQMVFVELCPYSTRKFRFSNADILVLASEDMGFRTAAQVRRLLIEEASPAFVLVNGVDSLRDFERLTGEHAKLEERRYTSNSASKHRLWHKQGFYRTGERPVPVVGFPFLGKPKTHNSYEEIDQLGLLVKDFLAKH